jgi:hypothetical protein
MAQQLDNASVDHLALNRIVLKKQVVNNFDNRVLDIRSDKARSSRNHYRT